MATLKLQIVTPEAKVFEDDVNFVQLPGAEGDMGVYPQHETLITELVAGELHIQKDGKTQLMAIGEGFAEITATSIGIITDGAVNEKEIDEHGRRGRGQAGGGAAQEQLDAGRRTRGHPGLARPLARPAQP